MSLALRPGETTALVGRSGSGKSSLGKLLLRSRDPTSGRVTVDGVEDTLMSPDAEDDNYTPLIDAHINRLAELMGVCKYEVAQAPDPYA